MDGGEFKQLRRLAGLTQEETARVLDVTHRTVMRWEHGDSRIKPLIAQSIKARLLARLFGRERSQDES